MGAVAVSCRMEMPSTPTRCRRPPIRRWSRHSRPRCPWGAETQFRQRRASGIRIGFDEMRSTPTEVLLIARVNGSGPVVTVFSFQGRRIVTVQGLPLDASRPSGDRGSKPSTGGAVVAPLVASVAARTTRLIWNGPQGGGRAGGQAVAVADHRGAGAHRLGRGLVPGGVAVEQQKEVVVQPAEVDPNRSKNPWPMTLPASHRWVTRGSIMPAPSISARVSNAHHLTQTTYPAAGRPGSAGGCSGLPRRMRKVGCGL